MSRSNQIDATAWRNVMEFERLATIYLGFFKDTTQASQEVQKHKD